MTKNAAAARGFLGSLVLLVVALVVSFVVLYPDRGREVEPIGRQPVVQDLVTESRRQSMRPVPQARSSLSWDVDDEVAGTRRDREADPVAAGGEEDPDIEKAVSLVDSGNVAEALTLLEGVLKRDPKNEQALVEMAMIQLFDLKQPDQAVTYLQRVMEVNSENLVVMTELVSLYEEQGRVDEGLAFLMGVHNGQPDSPELSHGVAQMLTLAGRDQEAVAFYEKATLSTDYHVRAHRDLADAYSRIGESEKAIDAYTKAIASQEQEIADKASRGLPVQFPEERMAYTKRDMARELIEIGDIDRAQAILDEISRIMPGDETITALRESIRARRG